MQDIRWQQRFDNYTKLLAHLARNVAKASKRALSDDELGAMVHFFSLGYQLAIAVMRDYMTNKGMTDAKFPKDIVRQAFKTELIRDGQIWIDILEARNKIEHLYNEEFAKELERDIPQKFYPVMQELAEELHKHYDEQE